VCVEGFGDAGWCLACILMPGAVEPGPEALDLLQLAFCEWNLPVFIGELRLDADHEEVR